MGVWFGISRNDTRSIIDGAIAKNVRLQLSLGIRDSLALLQDHHKTKSIRRGGGKPVVGRWTTRSGEASRSFHIDYRLGAVVGSYGSALFRIRALELGAIIYPRKAKYLRFKIDGEYIMRRSVVLPPRPTLENARKATKSRRDKIISNRVDKALKE